MAEANKYKIDTDEMMEAGVHLGHRASKLHPHMEGFVVGIRNTVHVIDLEKTAEHLEKALGFIAEVAEKSGIVLFCGTKAPLRNLIKEFAQECKMPYVVKRWLGGTFTNFKVLAKRCAYFKNLQKEKTEGKLDKYTKKEKIKIEKELQEMKEKFEGIQDMEKLPEAIFICDIVKEKLALKEARLKGIKSIAIVDTNADPMLVDYPIPANDGAISSVKYILEKVKEALLKSKIKKQNAK